MSTKPKLTWMGAALWFFGTIGFVSLALATLSMFVYAQVRLTPIKEGYFTYACLTDGKVEVKRFFVFAPFRKFGWKKRFPSFLEKKMYGFHVEKGGEIWTVSFPLLSIAVISLLAFLFLAMKARKVRRKIFLVTTTSQS